MTASVRVAPDLLLTTLVSEPERGEGGLASYRGNWGAAFVERIVRWLEPKRVLDPAVGGGTTVAVCQRLGVQVEGYDLNPHPPLGQGGFDMRRDEPAYAPDAILLHPPYGNLVRYSGGVWGERPDPRDLSAIDDWPTFVREMNSTILHLWATLRVHGHMAVLVGDIVRHGAIQSMQHELAWCGTPIRTIIKVQHNARSYRATYRGTFVPVVHEYLLVFSKDEPYGVRVVYTVTRDVDLRRRDLTWLQIVQASVEALGGRADLTAVYDEVARQFGERVAQAQWWREKVRQVLQGPRFVRLERGVYGLA